ncbi:hypothetical protein AB0N89_00555 [Amycolatopsis sp. NPDC089917]|uniref:hypothetical protein n=1 Tax=Amycolatopsis sp. NPDC089917 TaxID=3155187 RepID=UPI00343F689D
MPGRDVGAVLAGLVEATRTGSGLRSVPEGVARVFGMDALTVSGIHGGLPELVWSDPAKGLGPELEELQFALGDGPTWQAARQSRVLTEPDLTLTDHGRWPAFLPAAIRTSARAVIAVPLQLGAATVGVMTGYRVTPVVLTTAQRRDIRRLGRILLLLLLNGMGSDPWNALSLRRAEVHQATGYLSAKLGIPLDEALARLRAHAAASESSLTEHAHALLTRRSPPEVLDL